MNDRFDRTLGMDRDITRRDFLNGTGIALTGALAHPWFESPRPSRSLTYADFGDPLTDPEWKTDAEKPWVIGRQRFGRIAIANSDAGHSAETQTAIDEGHRSVHELLAVI